MNEAFLVLGTLALSFFVTGGFAVVAAAGRKSARH